MFHTSATIFVKFRKLQQLKQYWFVAKLQHLSKFNKFDYLQYITVAMVNFWAMGWKDFVINR